jgi:brefeldin A-inhibited guanine nucleotide-exchange protein
MAAESPRISTSSSAARLSSSSLPGSQGGGSSSDVFLRLSLDQLNSKGLKPIQASSQIALATLEASNTGIEDGRQSLDPPTLLLLFTPFQLACETRSPALVSISIDCLGKLFSYNFWGRHSCYDVGDTGVEEVASDEVSQIDQDDVAVDSGGIMGLVIDSICDCFDGPDVDEKIQMQILKVIYEIFNF